MGNCGTLGRVMPHVLHVSDAINTGLAHCLADEISRHLAAGGSATVACPDSWLARLAQQAGARVVPWRPLSGSDVALALQARQLGELVEQTAPAVAHLHGSRAGMIGRMAIRGRVPTVFSPYGWAFLSAKGLRQRLIREWERFAARWTAVTICASQGEAATGRRNGVRGRFAYVPPNIDVAPIDALCDRDRASVRAELGLSAGQPVVVCAARLCEQKGQDVAVAAWPLVRDAIPNAELVLVGDGPARRDLEQQMGMGIRFIGRVERETALAWMYAADIVICPSRWEGSSLVPLEARELGRPVVASDADGMREAVAEDIGRVVPANFPRALTSAVIDLLANPGRAMDAGFRARKLALEERLVAGDEDPNDPGRLSTLYAEVHESKSTID